MEHAPVEPHWLTTPMALEIHRRQIARYGGSDGVRDLGLLDSALNRPPQRVPRRGAGTAREAGGEMGEEALTDWFARHLAPR